MGEFYVPDLARGVRWNDPTIGIKWPLENAKIGERDAGLPALSEVIR
jgi:dTDP-4-dehydrorhamnose 3,5-epimerase